ncbi:helix-turn-helix transcriptional regulator [Streptomyces sp. NPDC095613]|uniref:helix-turn-helix transcriptional regulator n=1 Tax=Streptomyces sp. NPDC095613 TaxID=3155540 RepID=UPI0033270211
MHPTRHIARRPAVRRAYVTRRETEALRLAANGHTNRAIGGHLGVGVEAVNSLMQSAFRKLRVHDRAQAVAVGLRLGILALDDVTVPEGANQGWRNSFSD